MCNQCQCNQTTSATPVSARANIANSHMPTVPAIVGHRYQTRSQGVVTVEAYVAGDNFPYKTDKGYSYLESGEFFNHSIKPHSADLVKDLTLEAATKGTVQGKTLADASSLLKINYRKPAVSPIESIEVLRSDSISIEVSADGPAMVNFRARGSLGEISYSLKLTEVDALVEALQLMKNQQLAANGAGQGVWGGSY